MPEPETLGLCHGLTPPKRLVLASNRTRVPQRERGGAALLPLDRHWSAQQKNFSHDPRWDYSAAGRHAACVVCTHAHPSLSCKQTQRSHSRTHALAPRRRAGLLAAEVGRGTHSIHFPSGRRVSQAEVVRSLTQMTESSREAWSGPRCTRQGLDVLERRSVPDILPPSRPHAPLTPQT